MNRVLAPTSSFCDSLVPDSAESLPNIAATQTDWIRDEVGQKHSNHSDSSSHVPLVREDLDACLTLLQDELWQTLNELGRRPLQFKVGKTPLKENMTLTWDHLPSLPGPSPAIPASAPSPWPDGIMLFLAFKGDERPLSGSLTATRGPDNDENNNDPTEEPIPEKVRQASAVLPNCNPLASVPSHETVMGQDADHWKSRVTLQRGVEASELESLFKEDRFRHRSIDEPSVLTGNDENLSDSTEIRDYSSLISKRISSTKKKSVRWNDAISETALPHTAQVQSKPHTSRRSRPDRQDAIQPGRRGQSADSMVLPPGHVPTRHLGPRSNAMPPIVGRSIRRHPRSQSAEHPPSFTDEPIGVLTSNLSELRSSSPSAKVPSIHNMIHRIRCNHVRSVGRIWFGGPSFKSFNSRCIAGRFDRHTLNENAKEYFYFRSLPRISQ